MIVFPGIWNKRWRDWNTRKKISRYIDLVHSKFLEKKCITKGQSALGVGLFFIHELAGYFRLFFCFAMTKLNIYHCIRAHFRLLFDWNSFCRCLSQQITSSALAFWPEFRFSAYKAHFDHFAHSINSQWGQLLVLLAARMLLEFIRQLADITVGVLVGVKSASTDVHLLLPRERRNTSKGPFTLAIFAAILAAILSENGLP